MIVFKIMTSYLIFIDTPLFVIFAGKAKKQEEIQFIKENSVKLRIQRSFR